MRVTIRLNANVPFFGLSSPPSRRNIGIQLSHIAICRENAVFSAIAAACCREQCWPPAAWCRHLPFSVDHQVRIFFPKLTFYPIFADSLFLPRIICARLRRSTRRKAARIVPGRANRAHQCILSTVSEALVELKILIHDQPARTACATKCRNISTLYCRQDYDDGNRYEEKCA